MLYKLNIHILICRPEALSAWIWIWNNWSIADYSNWRFRQTAWAKLTLLIVLWSKHTVLDVWGPTFTVFCTLQFPLLALFETAEEQSWSGEPYFCCNHKPASPLVCSWEIICLFFFLLCLFWFCIGSRVRSIFPCQGSECNFQSVIGQQAKHIVVGRGTKLL